MSHEELIAVITANGELVIDERDPCGRLRRVAQGRVVGADQRGNRLRIADADARETVIRLTGRHHLTSPDKTSRQVRAA